MKRQLYIFKKFEDRPAGEGVEVQNPAYEGSGNGIINPNYPGSNPDVNDQVNDFYVIDPANIQVEFSIQRLFKPFQPQEEAKNPGYIGFADVTA